MEIRLLGTVTVVYDDVELAIDAPMARRCLTAIALAGGSVTLDRLADALWGDLPPANWKASIRNVVAKVRAQLATIAPDGADTVATTSTGYQLEPACVVDVHAGIADADAADEALGNGDPERALELATGALGRLTGELLEDVDAGWLTGYRTRVSWARTRSLQVAAAASRTSGRSAQAVDFATQAVLAEALAEESHRQLIEAHAAAGDRAAALRAYEACRRTLAAELGITPDQATIDLHLRILGTEESRPAHRRVSGPFFGRDHELAQLKASARDGAFVSIVGPGGIGKSRLAAAFAAEHEMAGDIAAIVLDVEAQGRGSDLATSLARVLGVVPGATDDVVGAVLDHLATRGSSLLVLDGIDHIADDAAGLITRVAGRCPETTVVATCRVPIGLDFEVTIHPAPLDPDGDGYACFVSYAATSGASLASDAGTRAAISDVCRAVGGIPLGIELAARQVAEVSLADLADRLAIAHLDDDGRPVAIIDAVVESTLGLLDEAELEVFRRLSVLGGPADLALIEATVADDPVPARRVVRILAQLADRALVRLDRTSVRWRYDQHPLLRAAARDLLTGDERRRMYGQLSAALFARLPPNAMSPPRLGDIDPIVPALRSVFAAALAGDADLSTALRLAYHLHRYWAARSVDEGIRWLDRLLDAAPGDDPNRGPAEVALGYLLHWSGRPDPAVDHLLAATSRLAQDDPLLALAHYLIANAAENRQPDVARRHFTIAISVASAAGRHDLGRRCRLGLSLVEFEAGERDAGLERYESVLRDVENGDADDSNTVYLPQYASMLISVSRFDEAHRALQLAEAALGDDVRITAMHTAAVRARLERHRGRLAAAKRHAQRAAEMIERAGVGRMDGLVAPTLALVELAGGRPDAAIAELARGAKAANETEQVAILADIVDAAVLVAIATGRTTDAVRLKTSVDAMRAQAQVQRGDPEQAEIDVVFGESAGATARPRDTFDRSQVVDLIAGLAGR